MKIDYVNHTRNIAAFVEAMDGGKLLIDGAEARKAVALIEAVYASAASGKPVRVR
jgi:predicted dehydrogenase